MPPAEQAANSFTNCRRIIGWHTGCLSWLVIPVLVPVCAVQVTCAADGDPGTTVRALFSFTFEIITLELVQTVEAYRSTAVA